MDISFTQFYPVSPEAVFEKFVSEDFIRDQYAAVGAKNVEINENRRAGSQHFVKTKREVAADVPKFAKKIFPATNTLIEEDTWRLGEGRYDCDWTLDIKGTPAKLSGSITLAPKGEGTEHTIRVHIKVKIPLIGGKIEKLIADDTKKSIDKEFEYNVGVFGAA